LAAFISETIGGDPVGSSYVVNLFKQKVVSQTKDLFPTVTPPNNIFSPRPSGHLHCTNRPFTYVLRKVTFTLSCRSKRTQFRKNVLNEISCQRNLNRTTWPLEIRTKNQNFLENLKLNCD